MATIYVLVEHARNRALLADRLSDDYDVVDESDGDPTEAAFDLCLGDVEGFDEHRETLERLKSETEPTFLPYVLLVHGDQTNAPPPGAEPMVDDVIELPIRPALLETRIENVLRTRRLSLEHQQRARELEILNRVVRHDIRNDTNVVLGWLDRVGDYVDDEGRPALERAKGACEHVVEITTIAREYVESLVGEERGKLEPIDVGHVLRHEVAVHRGNFPKATFDLSTASFGVDVVANEMLSSVFRNLLKNAVVHSDKDDPHVDITTEVTAETVVVRVADDGPGIPDVRKEMVFGEGEAGLESPGTGMGLFLVSEMVNNYGGTVRVEDNDPRGSVFVVELPRVDDRPGE